jgi:uncharacterized phage protein gp47/JayE
MGGNRFIMGIIFPTYEEIIDRVRADISRNYPGLDPTIYGSVIRAVADSFSGRVYDIIQLQQQVIQQLMPQTATDEYLEQWASWQNIERITATAASGLVTFTGVVSSVIPIGTTVSTSAGALYTTQAQLTLSTQTVSISSLTRSGTTATATCTTEHGLATGKSITISGATQTAYNGTFTVNVTGLYTFTYTVSNYPDTPATGTISGTGVWGSAEILSSGTGLITNLDSGSSLALATPITGVDTYAIVQYSGITGGADNESDTSLRSRTMLSRKYPVTNFNIGAIQQAVLNISGVTRCWIKRCTPAVGQVTIYFMRDDDTDPIPSGAEIIEVEDVLYDMCPAQSDTADIIVHAPTPVATAFTFTDISPDTTTMKAAITASLQALFADEVDLEETLLTDKYRSAIINTIDPNTGEALLNYSLSAPTSDITVTSGEIATLGTITFPV